ncbi:bifunctional 2',3'-cyclic-nucleotide 2'-phosphodiesterase/3'-nucleotidase [Thioclava litoralis]|uniref:Bifunctional 2',3'-cyclic-nucleotide 2'-phosphodiesterase/3'-nucleotidase n=1 Tax=Thioclava litoralis TaxID=3076557 RepID=A0ABZ1DUX9_9RHOB|nr:bifunctional 2',3'-cyclic-nucleotide 2'-phosphodiesterase/3'-nucleotidase [Thioclava sp. FTW29]
MSSHAETPSHAERPAAVVRLRLLATTDLHGHIRGYDLFADREDTGCGLSRVATLIERARTGCPNTLLFDNGDFLQGTPLTEYWARDRQGRADAPHPVIDAMNALAYDAVGLGNHEFNYGLDFLTRSLRDARFPCLSANALRLRAPRPEEDVPLTQAHVVLEKDLHDENGDLRRVRIGVFSVLPPQFILWDSAILASRLQSRSIIETARAQVAQLRAQGCDLVIALAHTGIDPLARADDPTCEHAATLLAQIDGIDALIAGHDHIAFPGPDVAPSADVDPVAGRLYGVPTVTPGRFASHLGQIDLDLVQGARGWQVAASCATLIPVAQEPPVPEAERIVTRNAKAHAEVQSYTSRRVARLDVPLHSYFSLVGPDAALSFVAQAQRDHVQSLLADRPEGELPLLSAVAPCKSGGRAGADYYLDIPPGPLSIRHLSEIYLFPNIVTAVVIDGKGLKSWLERASIIFNTIADGTRGLPLIRPEIPAYNFDIMLGVTYEIDLSAPPVFDLHGMQTTQSRGRIRNLCYQGRPVDDRQSFVVATNNYRSAFAGQFAGLDGLRVDLGPDIASRDVLIRAARAWDTLHPAAIPIWQFRDQPQTSVTMVTGKGALAYHRQMEDLGMSLQDTHADGTVTLCKQLFYADACTGTLG